MIADEPPTATDGRTILSDADAEGVHVEAREAAPDPRRWITLTIVLTAVLIAGLDTTVLNVAIPTILREFDTTLSSLQWVVTGYSLTFAALLIVGGRLADIFGSRRIFMIGAAFFGVGSLIAAVSGGVVPLVVGEAIIEGTGAALMLPASMGILSSTFVGRERATAFAAWGAVMGAALAFGPLLGGFLTTHYSWRWAFVINVIVAPLAILGALVFMRTVPRSGLRERIDVPGALLIASGMFLFVFAISEGGTYGWFRPQASFAIAGATVWPDSMPVSVSVLALVASLGLLFCFWRVEQAKERVGSDPLFLFSNLRLATFRYGLVTMLLLAMGQVSLLFTMSVVLQDGRHLSAVETGLWLVPGGLFIVAGSQLGSWLTRRIGTTNVVRAGLILEAAGLAALAVALSPSLSFLSLLPGLVLFGTGIGFASSQLNNVILSEIPAAQAGAASGASSTVRMVGAAISIAVISSLLSLGTIRQAVAAVGRVVTLPADLRDAAIAHIRTEGINFQPPSGISDAHAAALRHAIDDAVVSAARSPLIFAAAAACVGIVLSFLIPHAEPHRRLPARHDG